MEIDVIPQSGLDLIKTFEGCEKMGNDGRVHSYPDPKTGGKPYTIGYGSTKDENGKPFSLGVSISKEQAESLFLNTVRKDYWESLKETIPYWKEMNDNQRAALLSFAYNLGPRFFGAPNFNTITNVLKNKQWDKVPDALLLYHNPGSNVAEGLKKRRQAEGKLWATPV